MGIFKRKKKKTEVEPEEVSSTAEGGELEEEGGAPPPEALEEGGPPEGRDFFELEPEDVASWRPPGPQVARKKPNLAFRLPWWSFIPVVIIGLVILLIILFWPSSTAAVPDLVGKDVEAAMDAARSEGFQPRVVKWEYSNKDEDGSVISQNPKKGQVVKKGSRISLNVSKGPSDRDGKDGSSSGTSSKEGDESSDGTGWKGKTICLDPGHQARSNNTMEWIDPGMKRKKIQDDGGTHGVASGNPEHLVCLDIARKTKGLLEEDGLVVRMTRDASDVDMGNIARAEVANDSSAELLLRIECGAALNTAMRGTKTYYPAKISWTEGIYSESKTAAIYVQEETVKSCGTENLGIGARDDVTVFNWSEVPAIMIEVGYLSNPDDDELLSLDEFRMKVAWGLRNGILRYLENR